MLYMYISSCILITFISTSNFSYNLLFLDIRNLAVLFLTISDKQVSSSQILKFMVLILAFPKYINYSHS